MHNISALFFILLLAGQTLIRGCDGIVTTPIPAGERLYFNSFETPRDTAGWYGFAGIFNEAPPSGGLRSAVVSGGCIYPHAWYALPRLSRDSYLIIRCWGKNLSNGGTVDLDLTGYDRKITMSISEPDWRACNSHDTLFCPAGSSVRLSMSAGGIVPSSMLVDLIEIVRVN